MTLRLMLVIAEDRYLWSHRIGLAAAARDAGYDVTIVTRVSEHRHGIRTPGMTLIHVDLARGSLSPPRNLRAVHHLCAVYRRWRPHLVHHVGVQPIVLGSVAAAMAGAPMAVNALTGLGTALMADSMRVRLVRPILRSALGWALCRSRSHTIVQNPDNARFVESLGVRPERISLVRGAGVDIRRFRPTPEPENAIRVTMVSRLLWDKGVREFVDAAALVRNAREDVVFTLVGAPDEGNPTSVSSRQVRLWADDGLVEWWGYREDIADVLASSHIAVLPSYYEEGIPMALLEAAACGRPIVTTDAPGCREVVRHGVNGLLVPVRDARALADAVVALVDDPARRAAMGTESRRRAQEEFTVERIHQETLQVWERALSSTACGG